MDKNTHVCCTSCKFGGELIKGLMNNEETIPESCKKCYPYNPEDSFRFKERPMYVSVIKDDIKRLKFHKLSKKNNITLTCDYCQNIAIGTYIDENDDYNYVDVCEEHYKESLL